jgi:hypothetical protein
MPRRSCGCRRATHAGQAVSPIETSRPPRRVGKNILRRTRGQTKSNEARPCHAGGVCGVVRRLRRRDDLGNWRPDSPVHQRRASQNYPQPEGRKLERRSSCCVYSPETTWSLPSAPPPKGGLILALRNAAASGALFLCSPLRRYADNGALIKYEGWVVPVALAGSTSTQ